MSKSTSRRAVVTALAAAPALAIPVAAEEANQDARLIELGRQWDQALDRRAEAIRKCSEADHLWQKVVGPKPKGALFQDRDFAPFGPMPAVFDASAMGVGPTRA